MRDFGFVGMASRLCSLLLALSLLLGAGEVLAARTITSVTVNGGATTTVAPGATIAVVVNVTTDGSGDQQRWRCTTVSNLSGSIDVDHANHDSSGSYTETFNLTAPTMPGNYSPSFVAYRNNGCDQSASNTYTLTNGVIVVPPAPTVVSLNRANFNPASTGSSVSWTVVFNTSVTGVDASDFALVETGGAAGSAIQSVSGSGDTWTVQATTGSAAGSLRLNLVDNDSILNASGTPLGGAGVNNGNFTGQQYTLLPAACPSSADIIFCDDFERSNPGALGGGWTIAPASAGDCSGTTGNTGCSGIDSDIPPFNNYSNPRANPTRSMFTRWAQVTVQSPNINLAGKPGAQLSFSMRRGDDSFSECPEASGENYLVRYRASDGTWKTLAQYPSAPLASLCGGGPVYLPVIELPNDALHANFAMQFRQPSGSGDSGSGGAAGVRGYDYWHMDNVIVRETPASSYTGAFCDNFEGGLGRWSVTAEGAPGTAAIGDARTGTLTSLSPTHSLDLRWGYVTASTFKTDLSGVFGDITYWLKSGTTFDRDPDNGENLVVEYLNSSQVWTTLATYQGSAAAGAVYNGSHPIPANAKHPGFRLRFRQVNGSGYDKDYWHVDDVCVGDQLPTADLAITKTRSGSLVPGTNATYTLSVVNNGPGTLAGSLEVIDTLPAGLSYLAHAGAGWSCAAVGQVVTCGWSGSLVPGATAPALLITVSVSESAAGTLVNTASVSGTVNDNVSGNNTATDTASLYTPSYVFTDRACTNGVAIGSGATPCNLVNWSPRVAGQSLGGIYITALNASGVPTQLSATSATTVGFQFGLSCIDPNANAGLQASFSASASALPLCAAAGAIPSAWTASTNLSFPAASPSVGPYAFSYADVGQVELYLRNSAATSQLGSSGPFVVKPYSLVLTDIRQTAAPNTPNPAATTAGGSRFVRAGEAFSATVTAVNASCAANLATYTTAASIPASCRTPNFGREASPETVSLAGEPPTGLGLDNNPDIGNPMDFGSFTGGVATGTSFYWDEVGILKLTASLGDGNYLGAGSVAGWTTGNVGRFFADHFDIVLTPQCTGFVYAGQVGPPLVTGQPFTVTATAKSALASTLLNYTSSNSFAKSGNLTLTAGGTAGGLYVDAVAGGNGAIPAAKYVEGVATVAHDAASGRISYAFTLSPTLPTALTVHAEDADSASGTALMAGSDGSATMRAGRLLLSNAYGSELLPLSVPALVQFWTSAGWVRNSADGCTPLVTPTIGNAGLTNNQAAHSTATLSNPPLSGDLRLRLSAPGAGNAGLVDISGSILRGGNTWLALPRPSARACFGVCGPRSPVIYFRENY